MLSIKRIKRGIIRTLLSSAMFALRIFPVKKNKIVFSNFVGKGYGDNPKYICEELLKSYSIDAVWLVDNINSNNELPKCVRPVKYHSLRKFYELATAKVWVDNCRKGEYCIKRKKQYYVMTWHAGICLKKVEADAADVLGEDYVKYAMNDSKQIDLMLSNSRWCTDLYKNSFWYDGEILERGLPRHDLLVNGVTNLNVKDKLGIPHGTKIVLYAPTFRNNKSVSAYDIDPDLVIEQLSSKFDGDWVFLIRLHPSLNNAVSFNSANIVIDVSGIGDLYELLSITDVVISDYSSLIFDFAETKRPVFLYSSDFHKYNDDRGMYFDTSSIPMPFATSNEELCLNISNFSYQEYVNKIKVFFKNIGLNETGLSSIYTAEKIIEQMR